jgi:uncharacterized protein YkwD
MVQRALIGCVAILVGASMAAPAHAGNRRLLAPVSACPRATNVSLAVRAQVRAMRCLHRYARRAAARPSVRMAWKLRRSSARKARDIRRCQDFSHSACRRDPFYWFIRFRYPRGSWGGGENIALGSGKLGSARSIMRAWLRSPLHRKVLLTSRFREFGLAMVRGRFEGHRGVQVWVAHFGYRS